MLHFYLNNYHHHHDKLQFKLFYTLLHTFNDFAVLQSH